MSNILNNRESKIDHRKNSTTEQVRTRAEKTNEKHYVL